MSEFSEETTYGLELETVAQSGVYHIEGYHSGQSGRDGQWRYERDSTISSNMGEAACEMISPILKGGRELQTVFPVIERAQENGSYVNPSCGFHVHVGAPPTFSGDSIRKLFQYASNYEEGLYAVSSSAQRYQSPYSRRVRGALGENRIRAWIDPSRTISYNTICQYRLGVSVASYDMYGTVEFRLYRPSFSRKQIANAVQLSIGILEKACTSKKMPRREYAPHHAMDMRTRSNYFIKEAERLYARLGWLPGTFAKNPYGHLYGAPYSLRELADYGMTMAERFQRKAEQLGIL